MVKMTRDGQEYEIAEHRVEKLLKRGFELVSDTPEVVNDQDDQQTIQGE